MLGLKFRRQHPVGGFVLDFYCPSLSLAIELDGPCHDTPEQAAHDAARSALLAARGIRVLRLPNSEVTAENLRKLIHPFTPLST
jgi:very-short-patch-repair endonuclease